MEGLGGAARPALTWETTSFWHIFSPQWSTKAVG